MKYIVTLLFLAISITFSAQNYNTNKGFVAEGYDVVSYFNQKAEKGDKRFTIEFDGAKFKFLSKENLTIFKENPKKYIPQYGGYCAYAIGVKGERVDINPKTFEIRDGKLYLFYNSWLSNKLDDWKEGDTKKLQAKGDKNWKEIKHQKN